MALWLRASLQSVLPQMIELSQCQCISIYCGCESLMPAAISNSIESHCISDNVPGSLWGLSTLISFLSVHSMKMTLTAVFSVWFKDSEDDCKSFKRTTQSKPFPQWYFDKFGPFSLSFSYAYTLNFSACYLYVAVTTHRRQKIWSVTFNY